MTVIVKASEVPVCRKVLSLTLRIRAATDQGHRAIGCFVTLAVLTPSECGLTNIFEKTRPPLARLWLAATPVISVV